jgi:hypothetical protein
MLYVDRNLNKFLHRHDSVSFMIFYKYFYNIDFLCMYKNRYALHNMWQVDSMHEQWHFNFIIESFSMKKQYMYKIKGCFPLRPYRKN